MGEVDEADWVLGDSWQRPNVGLMISMEARLKAMYEQGMSYPEMAEALGTKKSWVKNHLCTMRACGMVAKRPYIKNGSRSVKGDQLIIARMAPIYGMREALPKGGR